jgi:glycosyltransferase involved in cell wall biosynthesis
MNHSPLVSIIIPVYNRLNLFMRAVQSVIDQIYKNWELIIVDDGSEIDIGSFVRQIKDQIPQPVLYIRQENQGPGIARKKGLEVSSGNFIQYLDSDDELMPTKLSKQVTLMLKNPDAIMCYTPTITKGADGHESLRKFSTEYEPDLLKGTLEWRRWHTSSCLWHYPDKSIAFWSHYYNGEDVLHDVSVGIHSRQVVYIDEPLCVAYSDSNDQVSIYPKDKNKQERYKNAIFMIKVDCYNLLRKHQFIKNKLYANPLSERFLHSGLVLLSINDIKKGFVALSYCIRTSRYWIRTIFAIFALITSWFSFLGLDNYFRYLFLLYRKLTPEHIHFRRVV